ncbi:hypothetical protein CSAL01_00974 [Colletotrichum salicis]|uniref:Uncharacterized protein n=1 Tax=Colletotrichum salicis TaxID=1209931 RepID=A0A135UNJ9_9PEZI|nr:hypothetical protein CSAL01_00974 [Colletotrichum salicis]
MGDIRTKDTKDYVRCGKACKKASRRDFPCDCAPYCTTCAARGWSFASLSADGAAFFLPHSQFDDSEDDFDDLTDLKFKGVGLLRDGVRPPSKASSDKDYGPYTGISRKHCKCPAV